MFFSKRKWDQKLEAKIVEEKSNGYHRTTIEWETAMEIYTWRLHLGKYLCILAFTGIKAMQSIQIISYMTLDKLFSLHRLHLKNGHHPFYLMRRIAVKTGWDNTYKCQAPLSGMQNWLNNELLSSLFAHERRKKITQSLPGLIFQHRTVQ